MCEVWRAVVSAYRLLLPPTDGGVECPRDACCSQHQDPVISLAHPWTRITPSAAQFSDDSSSYGENRVNIFCLNSQQMALIQDQEVCCQMKLVINTIEIPYSCFMKQL